MVPTAEIKPRGSKKKKSQKLSTGEIVAIVVCCILAFLICLLCCLYYKQRERKNTERKDSWDISTNSVTLEFVDSPSRVYTKLPETTAESSRGMAGSKNTAKTNFFHKVEFWTFQGYKGRRETTRGL